MKRPGRTSSRTFATLAPSLADVFDPRSNSIAFLRCALAAGVLLNHSFVLGGFATDDPLATWSNSQVSLGSLGVDGFFVISGYLITRSFLSAPVPLSYAWRRVLRIFPGYWVCLLVTALVFAPIAYVREHGSLAGADWLRDAEAPLGYVTRNAFLSVYQWNIWGLLTGTPLAHKASAPVSFDGSLWTLRHEFDAYLLVGVAGVLGILQRARPLVIAAAVLLWVGLATDALMPGSLDRLPHGVGVRWLFYDLDRIRLWFMFALGALAFLYGRRVPLTSWAAVTALGVFAGSLAFGGYTIVGRIAFAYLCLWLGVYLPIRHFDRFGDFSYGIYIYAFPIQQLLVLFDVNGWGWATYVVFGAVSTLLLAFASWHLVEAPAQRLKSLPIGQMPAFLKYRRRRGSLNVGREHRGRPESCQTDPVLLTSIPPDP